MMSKYSVGGRVILYGDDVSEMLAILEELAAFDRVSQENGIREVLYRYESAGGRIELTRDMTRRAAALLHRLTSKPVDEYPGDRREDE